MNPRKMLAVLSLSVAIAAPAYAVDIIVHHDGVSPIDGTPSNDVQTASLNQEIEFNAIGSYFVDFQEDGEAFVMIVQDDIGDAVSPLGASTVDEYRFTFPGSLDDMFAIVDEGSAEGLFGHADVDITGNQLTVTFLPGAEFEPGARLVVSIDDLADQYADGDIVVDSDGQAADD